MAEVEENGRAAQNAGRRWAPHVVLSFTPVSNFFLTHYGKEFQITNGQAMLIIHLFSHDRKEDAEIFPSMRSLAERMDISYNQVRNYVKELEKAGYLKVVRRVGKPCKFDLTPLCEKLEEHRKQLAKEDLERAKRRGGYGRG